MRLFFDEQIIPDSITYTLSEEESKHIVKVLRLQEGDKIGLINGKGSSFTCLIISAHPKRCRLKILNHSFTPPPEYDIHIAIAPTKQMERIEWFVEKATEIGVTEISLILCKNTERNKLKIERLTKKAISAIKQSKRLYLPRINPLISFESFVNKNPNGLIAHCEENLERLHFKDYFQKTKCPILIGPEGDFTEKEIKIALKNGYKAITLGENRLRTETAALYACMYAKICLE